MMYLESFTLPIDKEDDLLFKRATHNGGVKFGYVDTPYPCGLFGSKELRQVHFHKITIFYGGNGSGKSTLLNLISEKLKLNRIAPLDQEALVAELDQTRLLVVAESAFASGCVGQRIASVLSEAGKGPQKLLLKNLGNEFVAAGSVSQLLQSRGLDGAGIAESVLEAMV